ncbi:hypothetical protein MMC14_009792 [Varicellaria rhodocarpa]|nr:hypothetical protein [Varicellaria rhodocarpa]
MTNNNSSSSSKGTKDKYAMQQFGKENDPHKRFLVTRKQDQSARKKGVERAIDQIDRVGAGGRNDRR